jgi:hypothetical protein
MNINHIGRGVNPHLPDMIQNHGPGYDATFIPTKIFQQRKLLWRQLQQVFASSRFTAYQIKLQVGGLQSYRFGLWKRGPAQEIP